MPLDVLVSADGLTRIESGNQHFLKILPQLLTF